MTVTPDKEKTALTDTEKAGAMIVMRGISRFILLLFAVFVGTALILNLISVGPGWGNVPWLIFCLYALLRAAR